MNQENTLMNQTEPASDAANGASKEKHKAGSRLAVAGAFAVVGQELKWVGTAMDVKAGMRHESGGLWNAFRKLFSVKETKEAAKGLVDAGKSAGHFSATLKVVGRNVGNLARVNKWHLILGATGGVAAGAIGWLRGGLLDDAGDLVHHPIRSLKIIAGLEAPPQKTTPEIAAIPASLAPSPAPEPVAPAAQAPAPTDSPKPATTIQASSIQRESTLQQNANQQSVRAV
jgi:hypothetical protein